MAWRDAFDPPQSASPPAAPPPAPGERRPLRVADLLAVVRVLDHEGDGTIPVTSWEPDEEGVKGRWHHVTRDVRILTARQVTEIREAATETPWRVHTSVKSSGDGWLIVTDPLTGESHEIRATDAPFAWTR